MFIGRENELAVLNSRYESKKKEFGVIYGRRRIGKTTLINEFLKNKEGLFFQAKKDSIYGNLRSFSYELSKIMNLPSGFVFSGFEEAFDSLYHYAGGRRYVIVIDEYPYIVSQDPGFPSLLQELIDHAPDNLFFLISGSDVSMLKKEIPDHNSPLYKRRTFEMNLRKLNYGESLAYLKDIDDENKIRFLSLTSTYPYYLSAIDFSKSFEENVKSLLFSEYGTFFTLPDQLLSNSTSVQDIYNAILHAVSRRKRTNKEIAETIHEEEAKVSKYISTLLSAEILEKRHTYMGNKKTVYYEISDPMLKFWYTFIFDNAERIRLNGSIVYDGLKSQIERFVSFGFEDVSRLYMEELNRMGHLGNVFQPFLPYKVEKSALGRSVEIDGLSDDGERLIVMECKYRKEAFDASMLAHLKQSAGVFPSRLKREYYLFSKSGFTEEILNLNDKDVHLITLGDLFLLK